MTRWVGVISIPSIVVVKGDEERRRERKEWLFPHKTRVGDASTAQPRLISLQTVWPHRNRSVE